MRITSLVLENIKSYRYEEIWFTEGLNAVCGLNGSGKTTVLEAIGFALFDYLPYDQKRFIREGEKAGTIRVRLLAGDGREYEIVRRIGGAYYVADLETSMKLAERKENVTDWVRANALGIDRSADLEALFKNAIGVPQGTMTADFQLTPVSRKHVFDSLLQVEEYRVAFEYLADASRYLKDRIADTEREMAGLETQTDRIPGTEGQLRELEERIREIDTLLAGLSVELAEAEAARLVLEQQKEQVRALETALQQRSAEAGTQRAMLEQRESEVTRAREARQAVIESEPGYRIAREATEHLAALEGRRQERDQFLKEQSDAKSAMYAANSAIEVLTKQWNEALEAADRAAALSPKVEEQAALELRYSDALTRAQQADDVNQQLEKRRRSVETLAGALSDARRRRDEAHASAERAGRLEAVQEELSAVVEQIAQLEEVRKRRAQVEDEGKILRAQFDQAEAQSLRRAELVEQIGGLRAAAESYETLQTHFAELREERARAQATVEYQNVARAELETQNCPLLEIKCPVVSADAGALDRFDTRIGNLQNRLRTVDAELETLKPELDRAKQAAGTVQTLQVQAAQLESSAARLEELNVSLLECRESYAELSKQLEALPGLTERRTQLLIELKEVQAAAGDAARLPDLEGQITRDEARLAEEQGELAELEERRKELTGVEAEVETLGRELQALGNPQREQQQLLGQAAKREEIEANRAAEQEKLQEASDRMRAIVGRLLPYAELDTELETYQTQLNDNRSHYDRYLTYRDLAEQLEHLEQAAVELREALARAERAEREARERLQAEQAGYDVSRHYELAARCKELGERIAAENGRHVTLENQQADVETELQHLRQLALRWQEKIRDREELQRVLAELEFIRATIKSAGPAVTEALVQNISGMASDIFSEIMDDHAAELRWDGDYEVLVQKGAETRNFAQLSGGEQMSAALAVRLALLKEMSDVDVAFFDEPTQNMDADRRGNLAGQIRQVRGFNQLIVISHDDTFEHDTDNLIRLRKENDETRVER